MFIHTTKMTTVESVVETKKVVENISAQEEKQFL